ncbi:hypothetical protein MAM1_0133d06177 [Mucor ambiguus]|uniref:F-BAR domain-containing protein n=1 Tax=Mucor ambiguus TaxID=91626 RepID=A0A0C9MH92_9FUNG|nr:hypothetical protein MAM1_0133d06177 [Mucor ambiguus]
MTEQIFANNFWGLKDDGFQVLTAKMNNNKKTFDEIKSFYNVRASLHEDFGRKLMKHTKASIGKEETGTLHSLLTSAHQEMEWTAQAHLNLAQKIKMRLEVDLDNFILEQKDKRKLTHTNVEKAHRYKQSSEQYLSKVKEKYESECAKLITMQTQIASVSGREAERMKQRMERTQHEIKVQEQEYRNACIKAADATDGWNKTWKMACDIYQGMEKKRLEFLHHSFSMYINVLSTASSQDQESYERFWKSLDQYDPMQDIQMFIQEKGTGPKIPEPEIFVDYMDDPAKTFQQHTIADFPVPAEFMAETSPIDKPKPELTVRNPTVTMPPSSSQEDATSSQLLQRGKSIAVSTREISEPPTPSKSTTERRKSIIRSIIKPLPSISTPLMMRKEAEKPVKHQQQQQPPSPPVLVVPETSSATTTDTSEDEIESPVKGSKAGQDQEEGDINIDPRAKVVFAIGNNMFDLGHLDLEDDVDMATANGKKANSGRDTNTTSRRLTTRRRQPSADLEAACNFSYQSLLEELGVFENNKAANKGDASSQVKKSAVDTTDGGLPAVNLHGRRSQRSSRRISSQQQHQQQQPHRNHQQRQQPVLAMDNLSYHTSNNPSPVSAVPQQDMYHINSNFNATQSRQQKSHYHPMPHQQQPQHQPPPSQQQQYYTQYPTSNTSPTHALPVSHGYHTAPAVASSNEYYHPPTNVVQGVQPTLFWALAITDWYSGKPEELQFSRGTWLAVTEARTDGWYFAVKFDSRMNSLTNEKGYVAQHVVQVYN